jgi:hypothetical protein
MRAGISLRRRSPALIVMDAYKGNILVLEFAAEEFWR